MCWWAFVVGDVRMRAFDLIFVRKRWHDGRAQVMSTASTPAYLTTWNFGGCTAAAKRQSKLNGSMSTATVPSEKGRLSSMRTSRHRAAPARHASAAPVDLAAICHRPCSWQYASEGRPRPAVFVTV